MKSQRGCSFGLAPTAGLRPVNFSVLIHCHRFSRRQLTNCVPPLLDPGVSVDIINISNYAALPQRERRRKHHEPFCSLFIHQYILVGNGYDKIWAPERCPIRCCSYDCDRIMSGGYTTSARVTIESGRQGSVQIMRSRRHRKTRTSNG
jgi:hypothetical protein